MGRARVNIDNIKAEIDTILRLAGQWPNRNDLLEDSRAGLHVAVSSSTNPCALPHHLDRVVNTHSTTRTRHGAVVKLRRVWFLWGKPRPSKTVQAKGDEYTTLCSALLLALPRLAELDESVVTEGAAILSQLARDTIDVTAHGSEPTGIACPSCREGALARPYTDEGLLDVLTCDECGNWWSYEMLRSIAHASARYGTTDIDVTISDAARLLGEDPDTIWARASRRHAARRGSRHGRHLYRLSDLR